VTAAPPPGPGNGSALGLFRLDGKTALITGGSRNIGKAMAQGFADAGADLVLVARKEAALEEVAAAIRARTGRSVTVCVCDISSTPQVAEVVAGLETDGTHIDVLVNNAIHTGGTYGVLSALDTGEDAWRRTMEVNFFGALRLSQALVPKMVAAGRGVVINVISAAAFSPMATMGPYGVSKAALWALTQYLARECAPTVRVNALCPGSMREEEDKRPLSQAQISLTPMARDATNAEAVGAALYLASDASSFSTGDIVFCNGGLSGLSSYFGIDPGRRRA
jgi:NAD(P)-dependent dehydrogenase (short-subunit alcohol dehydrogenase family)